MVMIAKGVGFPLVLSFIPSMILYMVPGTIKHLSVFFLLLPLFVLWFFRDPARDISHGIVSPADGRVMDADRSGISIFMSVTDVHVNRSPVSGILVDLSHKPGGYKPAYRGDSDRNEQQRYVIQTDKGDLIMTQYAGLVARRIVPYVKKGERLEKGQKIGMIRFGSRVDIQFPSPVDIAVKKGDKVKAGETFIGDWL